MKTGNLVSIVLLAVTLLAPVPNAFGQPLSALISTSKGEIELELNARAAPTTVANFVNLARRGFYDGLSFHRFEPRFMIQGGDPLGTGTGTPGYRFTHVRTPHLDGLHSVFGGVTQGMDVVNSLRAGDIIERITISGDISALWAQKAGQLESWNAVLNENYPDLRPAPTP